MESPFTDLYLPSMGTRNKVDSGNEELILQSPFLELENNSGDEMEWQGEEMVDEEEMEFDFHEGEEDDESGERKIQYPDHEKLYEPETPFIKLSASESLPVPVNNPVPFAPVPVAGAYWPIITTHSKGREVAFEGVDRKFRGIAGRRFLAQRSDGGRYHAGIDLWANDKDPIVACEDGVIVNFYHFYRSTYALLVEHKNIVINYGEVHQDSLKANNLKIGDTVKAGQRIGIVGKMYSSSMLHFETYKKGTRSNKRFAAGSAVPKELLNPTRYLLFLQQQGLQGTRILKPPTIAAASFSLKKDWTKAIEMNRKYGNQLGWNNNVIEINDLLLKITGQSNISLGEEAFAEAVAAWQTQQGFSEKDSDGVIGPNTWRIMKLLITSRTPSLQQPRMDVLKAKLQITSRDSVVINVSKYYGLIKSIGQGKINPNLVCGIIAAESGGNPDSGKNGSGYKGLMQAETTADQLDPATSIRTGIKKFIDFRDKTLNPWLTKLGISTPPGNDENYLKACLSCYNAGPVTALKAIQYAYAAGDWRQWLLPEHYQRALVFSGGYAQYPACNKGKSTTEIAKARDERIKYRFKTSSWRSEPDPLLWNNLLPVLNPIMRCWIETKFKNTPGYLDRFIDYLKYFEHNPVAHEMEDAVEYEEEDQFYPDELYEEERMEEEMTNDDETGNEEEMEWEDEEADMEEEKYNEFVIGASDENEIESEEDENESFGDFEPEQEFNTEIAGAVNEDSTAYEESKEETNIHDHEYVEAELTGKGALDFRLLYTEQSPPGKTIYINSNLKISGTDNITGIFVPKSFKATDNFELIIYLHGYKFDTSKGPHVCYKGICPTTNMDSYWKNPMFPLREALNTSARNSILVAPTIGVRSNAGSLIMDRGFDLFINHVLRCLVCEKVISPCHTIGKIILAAHSGGGSPILRIATLKDQYAKLVKECWCFDALYGGTQQWINWINANAERRFYSYYFGSTPASISEEIKKQCKRLPAGSIRRSDVRHHWDLVKTYWNERIADKTNGNGLVKEMEENEFAREPSMDQLTPAPSKPKTIWLKNTDLNAPYFGGNFNFLYNGGSTEAIVTFNTNLSFRKNFSAAEKQNFVDTLKQAVDIWDNAAEVQIKDINGNYNQKIRLRFKLNIVKNSNNANKKTDIHPSGTWSSWFNGANREIVMRNLNVFIHSSRNVLAHELGHVWGLLDEYDTQWIEMKFSPGHVGKGSPLLKDKVAIMNLGYQDEVLNNGEFRCRYFKHFGRKMLEAFWGIDDFMIPVKHNGKIIATTVIGRISLLKKDINGNTAYAGDQLPFNPKFEHIQITKRGNFSKTNKEAEWEEEENESGYYETDTGWENESEPDSYEAMDEYDVPEHQHYSSGPDFQIKDWSNAIRQNRMYGDKLGWAQFYDQINNLLLPFSGLQNASLDEEAFAQAVADWQRAQDFSEKDSDGIIGPMTWRAMQSFINTNRGYQPVIKVPSGDTARSTQNIFEFNRWHAQKILDTMNNGILSHNFKSKDQLEKIAGGEQVLFINPRTQLIKILPVIYHIAKQAQSENYKEIIIGSFIRGANKEGKCMGHCAGRCIDINYRGGSFETAGSVQMVKNILSYLISLPAQYKKSFGFGMPLQGSFFGDKSLTKFKSTLVSNLANADLQQLVSRMGIVFPDNDNHLHIQVNWEVNTASNQETATDKQSDNKLNYYQAGW